MKQFDNIAAKATILINSEKLLKFYGKLSERNFGKYVAISGNVPSGKSACGRGTARRRRQPAGAQEALGVERGACLS